MRWTILSGMPELASLADVLCLELLVLTFMIHPALWMLSGQSVSSAPCSTSSHQLQLVKTQIRLKKTLSI